jgi:NAD(P)-dependent dehydrogenase (short-subunit alcohol dehydrogenase family)
MADALRLFGLKAVVTGAASGIGEAIVRTFVKHGASVLAIDNEPSGIDKHYEALRAVISVAANIQNEGTAAKISERASSALGGIDILVCNVDSHPDKPLADADEEGIVRHLQRRITLQAGLFDAALSQLKRSPAGRVINIGSIRSEFAANGFVRSQEAVAALTKKQASLIGKFGITSNYIQPGAIMTPGSRRVFSAAKDLRDHCITSSAANRLGEPIDVAKVALFLATDESAFVSGTGIVVDGGLVKID